MTSRFKLESVLNHRKHIEERAQKTFAEASRKLEQARTALEAMVVNRSQYQQTLKTKMQTGAEPGELMVYQRYLTRLQKEVDSQSELIDGLEIEKEEQRAQLLIALKNRKVIEKLKERYQAEDDRHKREQELKGMNEAAISRYQIRPGSSD